MLKISMAPKWVRRSCAWAAARFLRNIHHLTHRIPVELRSLERTRALVVAPHMDDEMLGAGGTLALHRRLGSELGLVFTSDGAGQGTDSAENAREALERQAEAVVAAAFFDMEYHGTLGYPCGRLAPRSQEIGRDLAQLIRRWQPKVIFGPFPSDHHRDHQATALALAYALDAEDWDGEIWCYEVWSTLWPNVAVDISDVIDEKRRSIECYPSQLRYIPYAESILGLNRYRGLRVQTPSAEAFYVCSTKEFKKLSSALLRI